MEQPKRKSNRLTGYDYGAAGVYFLTICTHCNERMFWNDSAEETIRARVLSHQPVGADRIRPLLSREGMIVNDAILAIPKCYTSVMLDHYVIMPNHVHVLMHITGQEAGEKARTASTIIGQTKRRISKAIGRSIWQKSFHDHVVRDENDLQRIRTYIENNPANWESDCFYR